MKAKEQLQADKQKDYEADYSAAFVFTVGNKIDYEGNYQCLVNVRKKGTPDAVNATLLLQEQQGAWVIARCEGKDSYGTICYAPP